MCGNAVDWLEALRGLPPERRLVRHQPETPRYSKARAKLAYILRTARFLGSQSDLERPGACLLALWAPPGRGVGSGYYACFRVFVDDGQPAFAVLYCLYDGSERSPGFKTFEAARTYAQSQGFSAEGP